MASFMATMRLHPTDASYLAVARSSPTFPALLVSIFSGLAMDSNPSRHTTGAQLVTFRITDSGNLGYY